MSRFTVSSKHPIPGKDARITYPFEEMKVGDSFGFNPDLLVKVRGAVSTRKRNYEGEEYMVRRYRGAARCWRVK